MIYLEDILKLRIGLQVDQIGRAVGTRTNLLQHLILFHSHARNEPEPRLGENESEGGEKDSMFLRGVYLARGGYAGFLKPVWVIGLVLCLLG